jgi:hypothetical protein
MISATDKNRVFIPCPQAFELFQPVRRHYVSEDYTNTKDEGVVFGAFYVPEGIESIYSPGWWYVVLWSYLVDATWLALPHMEEVAQDELRLLDASAVTMSLRRKKLFCTKPIGAGNSDSINLGQSLPPTNGKGGSCCIQGCDNEAVHHDSEGYGYCVTHW